MITSLLSHNIRVRCDMKSSVENMVVQDKTSSLQCIIFSHNRAMQLHGLLRSLFFHCSDIKQAQITVLYKADERHAHQYDKLAQEFAGLVKFRRQQHFRRDTLSILIPLKQDGMIDRRYKILSALGSFGPAFGSFMDRVWRRTLGQLSRFLVMWLSPDISIKSYVLFLVDDNIFVRDFKLADILDTLRSNQDLLGFSLRLGENTTYCYSLNAPQSLPKFASIGMDMIKYDWTTAERDFGYPLEISSSLYRLKDILPYALGLPFENPNVLEERVAFYANSFSAKYSCLGCYRHSVTFCNPVNKVQKIISNRSGENTDYGVDDLALRFERGERIRVQAYSGFVPSACHQEVELVFERNVENE